MHLHFKLFLAFLVATSTVFSGVVASTHSHRADSLNERLQSESARCVCQCHPAADRKSDELPPPDEDHGTCLICQLIADFQGEAPQGIELEFESMVLFLVAIEPVPVSIQPIRSFQGRAPPAA